MDACLRLMAQGRLQLEAITTLRASFAEAPSVYERLLKPRATDIGVVFEYGEEQADGLSVEEDSSSLKPPVGLGKAPLIERPVEPHLNTAPALGHSRVDPVQFLRSKT